MKRVRCGYYYVDHGTKPLRIVTNIYLPAENIGMETYDQYPVSLEWFVEYKGELIHSRYQRCIIPSLAYGREITKKCLLEPFTAEYKYDVFTYDEIEEMIDRLYNVLNAQPYEQLITMVDDIHRSFTIH